MVQSELMDVFSTDSVHKQIILDFADGVTLTNSSIYQESMEVTESICSSEALEFGTCEASSFKITIANDFISRVGMKLNVSIVLNHDSTQVFQLGVYTVRSDVPTADRSKRELVAYDSIYDIINADSQKVMQWYNNLFPNSDTTVTLKVFRDSFFSFFDIEQEEVTLPNDDVMISKTVEGDELEGSAVVQAICQLNGRFGHINRAGKFVYIKLGSASVEYIGEFLYPGEDVYPGDDTYTSSPTKEITIEDETVLQKSRYKSCEYEDIVTSTITGLTFRNSSDSVGYTVGTTSNLYVIEGNFLVYDKEEEDLIPIMEIVFAEISEVSYRPANVEAVGNPCVEVGDGIKLSTKYATVTTYILTRTLSGIQALTDVYESTGVENYNTTSASVNSQLQQLKGRVHRLTVDVEKFESTITNYDSKMESIISQTEDKIQTIVEDLDEQTSSMITQTSEQISSIITGVNESIKDALDEYTDNELNDLRKELTSEINQSATDWTATFTTATQSMQDSVDDAKSSVEEVQTLIRLSGEGVEVGKSTSEVKLLLENGEIKFTANGQTLSTWTPSDFRVGNIYVELTNRFRIGDFSATPLENGNVRWALASGEYEEDTTDDTIEYDEQLEEEITE